ncbi:MAG: LacI family DNA-binding transcriptional regulator, partial [Lachnospiraceae bacterium]|nr:LacI family DNA-binding transcriptional regulator [Lachnospiraceae bacterium]
MKNEVTLNDIAKKVSVSSAAVSKALSGKEGVGEELKRKILEEARR